jgi:drug/metabolite transporter (DMT)-like permease
LPLAAGAHLIPVSTPVSPALVLALALIGISFAGPLVRLSHAHPLAIAIWRIGFSLIVIAAFLLGTGSWRQWRRLDPRGVLLALAAGAMLAVHFWSWNASVSLTTVAASVVLVNTQPALVAVLSAVWLREPPSRRQWLGIAVSMIGALVVAWPDLVASGAGGALAGRALLGDLLSLLGAATAAVYFVSGRRLRATLDLWPYVALVYGTCFVVLLLMAAAVHAPVLHQPTRELFIFLALALGPMLLGHTGLNWALRYMPAYVVNLTLLGEPVGATLLAAFLPGIRELPGVPTFVGGLLILAGIYVTTRRLNPPPGADERIAHSAAASAGVAET